MGFSWILSQVTSHVFFSTNFILFLHYFPEDLSRMDLSKDIDLVLQSRLEVLFQTLVSNAFFDLCIPFHFSVECRSSLYLLPDCWCQWSEPMSVLGTKSESWYGYYDWLQGGVAGDFIFTSHPDNMLSLFPSVFLPICWSSYGPLLCVDTSP